MLSDPQLIHKLIKLDEVDSTNNYLMQLSRQKDVEEFTVVQANFQNAGKGQKGNIWKSLSGENLLFSLLLRPVFLQARDQFILSQLISLSIKEALEQYSEGFSIKWPNDIYWQEKKICGILIENNLEDAQIAESIIGIGVNVNQQSFSPDLKNPVSLFQITGNDHDMTVILSNVINNIRGYYDDLKSGSTQNIIHKYHNSLFRNKGLWRFMDKNGIFQAEIIEIEPSGILVLHDKEKNERKYSFKEVEFVIG